MGATEDNLAALLRRRYESMPVEKRAIELRKLARKSTTQREFLKSYLPDLYREAHGDA
jgi:hypothetical protein